MTMLIFRVLILALGMLFFEQRRCGSFEDAVEKERESGFSGQMGCEHATSLLKKYICILPLNPSGTGVKLALFIFGFCGFVCPASCRVIPSKACAKI